jgi:hypothetical protein
MENPLNEVLNIEYYIERSIYIEKWLNRCVPHRPRIYQTGVHRRSTQFIMKIICSNDSLKLVGANMNVLLALRLLSINNGILSINKHLYEMAKCILSRQNRQDRNQTNQNQIVVLPEDSNSCVPTNKSHSSLPLTAIMSFNTTKIYQKVSNDKVAICISTLPQRHDPYIRCGLAWHSTTPILGVFDYIQKNFKIYDVSLKNRSTECVATIPVEGVFAILPHQNSFILVSKENDHNMKIWRICLETMSMTCIENLLNSVYSMQYFSILLNEQMIIADLLNDRKSLTISNRSGTLMSLNFDVERYGFNRISSILFASPDIMIIGTDGGEIKLFQLSSDYLSATCFASFKEPECISSNSGIITFSIMVIAVHPLDPSIIAVRVKLNCVKVFKWSLNPPEIVLLAERTIGRNNITSISFSTDSSLFLGCIDGKNIVL